MFVLGKPRAVILGMCPAVEREREREKERPVRLNSFPRRDLSHTEVTISVSHGAFLRIKGRRDEKMKEENTKGRPILPGDLFSHTHLC